MGWARLTTLSRVDLPTLGKPTSPTSASSFSSSTTSRLSPGRPGLAKRGTWRVGVAKCWLPHPPRPPRHRIKGVSSDISRMISPVAASRMTVPRGTWRSRSSPSLPVRRLPPPGAPLPATYFRL